MASYSRQPQERARTIKVTILASEWGASKGGLSTINRELAIQLAKSHDVKVTFFLPKCSLENKEEAKRHDISVVEAEKKTGFEELDWLSFAPQDLQIDIVVGHGVKLGKQAQVIRKSHNCKWIQVVHTDPEKLGMFKCYENPIPKGEIKHHVEVELCQMADLVVGVGPKLTKAFRKYLGWCKTHQDVLEFTPSVFTDFDRVKQALEETKPRSVLVFGRGDDEDFKLKGFDIAARSVAAVPDTDLVFVGAQDGKEQEIAKLLLDSGIPRGRLVVRGFKDREALKQLFCEVDLVLMPSRTEGFGLTGLEALSARLPVIVSKNSGFGEALGSVPFGSSFVIDSEDPSAWTAAIKGIWNKDRQTRLDETKVLRDLYGKRYSWSEQCENLIEKMGSLLENRQDVSGKLQVSVEEDVERRGASLEGRTDSRPAQSEGECSVPGNELNATATNSRPAQSEGEHSNATATTQEVDVGSSTRDAGQMIAGAREVDVWSSTRARRVAVWSSTRDAGQMIAGGVGLHCTFRTLRGELLVVGTGLILWRRPLGDFAVAFTVATLPAGNALCAISEGSVCFTVQAKTSLALDKLYDRYRTGQLQRDLQDFLVTDVIRQVAAGEGVVLSVYINEEELREVLDGLTNGDLQARRVAVWSSTRAAGQMITGGVGLHCTFRTLRGELLVVGTGLILCRRSLADFVKAFTVATLPAANALCAISEGSVCFTVQAETSVALDELYQRYYTGQLQRDLQDFLVTDVIRQLAAGGEVVLSVYINEEELREVLDGLTNGDLQARQATVGSSTIAARIKGGVGLHCTFRTLSGVVLVVGTGLILRRCFSLGDFFKAFRVATLPATNALCAISEGSICFTVGADPNSDSYSDSDLAELQERFSSGRLQRDLQEFLVTDDIRELADGEEVVLSVHIEKEGFLVDLTDVKRKGRPGGGIGFPAGATGQRIIGPREKPIDFPAEATSQRIIGRRPGGGIGFPAGATSQRIIGPREKAIGFPAEATSQRIIGPREKAIGFPAGATSQRIIGQGDGKSLTRPGSVESQESPSCGPK
ncbi:uncharacterized protein [Acropora muricata]|uniref:uncharacterized protein isoform X9 n=1 Tax=Acropora muricata TaxID=159855 RepID=UPI0034E504C7